MALTIVAGVGCGSDTKEEQGQESTTAIARNAVVAPSGLGTVGESAGQTDISIAWKQIPTGGAIKKASDTLVAQIVNNTDTVQQGRIILTASGLDARTAGRELGKFNLAPRATADVTVPVGSLPIQSELAPSLAMLEVELNRGKEVFRPSHTQPTYYIFSGGYAQAELYNDEEVMKLPNGGLRTADMMDVTGRVQDNAGVIQEVSARAATLSQGPRQGLTRLGVRRARPDSPPPYSTTASTMTTTLAASAATAGFSRTNTVSVNWSIWYTDSGLGEDKFPLSGWRYASAAYAWLEIASTDFSTVYYNQPLDMNGTTYYQMNLPANTQLVAHIWTDWQIDENGTQFDNWNCNDSLVCTPFETDMYFTTGPEGAGSSVQYLTVPAITNSTQTAAVAGLILQTNNLNGGNVLGIVPGSHYRIHANLGCPITSGGYDPLKSCFNGTSSYPPGSPITAYLYFGPQSGGYNQASHTNEAGANWKFIVAHEIGHAIQFNGFGSIGTLDYAHGDPASFYHVCRCDNVTSAKEHCLNSREDFNAAETEGFAQFFATRVFNFDYEPNATMVYYKQFQNSNTMSDFTNPPMAKDGLGNVQRQWMVNKCPLPRTGRGVEWDWLQFYYDISSQDSNRFSTRTLMSDLFNIYRLACTSTFAGYCNSNNSDATNPNFEAIRYQTQWYYQGDQRYTRFNAAGSYHGVNY